MTQAQFGEAIGVRREAIARAEGKPAISSEMEIRVNYALKVGTLVKVRGKRK